MRMCLLLRPLLGAPFFFSFGLSEACGEQEIREPHHDSRAPHGFAGDCRTGTGFGHVIEKQRKTSCRHEPAGPVCGTINGLIAHSILASSAPSQIQTGSQLSIPAEKICTARTIYRLSTAPLSAPSQELSEVLRAAPCGPWKHRTACMQTRRRSDAMPKTHALCALWPLPSPSLATIPRACSPLHWCRCRCRLSPAGRLFRHRLFRDVGF